MKENILKLLPFVFYFVILVLPIAVLGYSQDFFYLIFGAYILYGTFKSFNLLYGVIGGYHQYKKEVTTDWLNEINVDIPHQLIAIPVNKEDISIIKRNLDSILKQNYDITKLFVCISIEANQNFAEVKKEIEDYSKNTLAERLLVVEHYLADGEVPGAASNRTNAVKKSVVYLKSLEMNVDEFLVTSPDADTVFHKNYFARVAFEWIIDSKKENIFYQTGIYKFDNNINRVPVAIRIVSIGITLGTLSSAYTENENRYTFSCFTMPLKTLIDINYWDTSISIDDSPIYWRAYKFFEGDFKCRSFYIPISVDCIESENYLEAHLRQYKQIHRWGWGIIVFPEAIKSIFSAKIYLHTKILKLVYFLDVTIFLKALPAAIIVLLFLSQTTGLLSSLSYISFILLIIGSPWVFKLTLENSKMSLVTIIITVLLFLPLGLVNIFVYCLFPFLQAAAEYGFGMNIDTKINWATKIPDEN